MVSTWYIGILIKLQGSNRGRGNGAETMAGVAVHRARKPRGSNITPVQHVT